MKRFVLALVLVLVPVLATAGGTDRRHLLTGDGTLFTIESDVPATTESVASTRLLRLTTQKGEKSTTEVVPASIAGGMNLSPSLAYDKASSTLFVFWQRMPNFMSSELLICSVRDGQWSEPVSIENSPFHFRYNLRIGLTRFARETDPETEITRKPFVAVHAVWWDESGYGENARYALLGIENGVIQTLVVKDLLDFVGTNGSTEPFALEPDYDRTLLRYPSVFELPGGEGVQIVFSDWNANRMHSVDVDVEDNGVLRLPIGVWGGEMNPPGKVQRDVVTESDITMIRGAGTGALAMAFRSDKALRYMILGEEGWSELTSIALSERVTSDSSLEALRGLLATQ